MFIDSLSIKTENDKNEKTIVGAWDCPKMIKKYDIKQCTFTTLDNTVKDAKSWTLTLKTDKAEDKFTW